jgi:hypothetical protein
MPGALQLWGETIDLLRRHAGLFGRVILAAVGLSTLIFFVIVVIANSGGETDSPLFALLYLALYIVIAVIQATAIFIIIVVAADRDEGRGETLRGLAGRALAPLGKSFVASLLLELAAFIPLALAGAVSFLIYGALFPPAADGRNVMLGNATFFLLLALLSLPVLWAGARFAPLPAIYAEEDSDLAAGLRRSWALSRGHGWRILRWLLPLVPLVVLIVGAQLAVPVAGSSVAMVIASILVMLLGTLLFWILSAAGCGVLYRRLVEVGDG